MYMQYTVVQQHEKHVALPLTGNNKTNPHHSTNFEAKRIDNRNTAPSKNIDVSPCICRVRQRVPTRSRTTHAGDLTPPPQTPQKSQLNVSSRHNDRVAMNDDPRDPLSRALLNLRYWMTPEPQRGTKNWATTTTTTTAVLRISRKENQMQAYIFNQRPTFERDASNKFSSVEP